MMNASTDIFVTLEHLYSVPGFSANPGFCGTGARALCKRYGIDWSAIIRDGGIAASKLEATNDALALHLVAHARIQEQQRG